MKASCTVLEEFGYVSDVANGGMPAIAGIEPRGIVLRGMLASGITTLVVVADGVEYKQQSRIKSRRSESLIPRCDVLADVACQTWIVLTAAFPSLRQSR